jgi:protein-tyrosine phosphatase
MGRGCSCSAGRVYVVAWIRPPPARDRLAQRVTSHHAPQLNNAGHPVVDTESVTFRILYVCTGNICRSPMAERLFRAWMEPGTDVEVSSAGMGALVGHGIDHSTASALGQLGVDSSGHRARQFADYMAVDADLILTASREHRDEILVRVPSTFKRIFTMREFARLIADVPMADPYDMVAAAAARRGIARPKRAEDDDLEDPFRGPIGQARRVAEVVTATIRQTLDGLGFNGPREGFSRSEGERPLPFRTHT